MKQIAAEFAGNVFDLPDFGPFTIAVKNAKWYWMNSLFVCDADNEPQNPSPKGQNPPLLPDHWMPGMNQVFQALPLFESEEAAARRAQSTKPTVTRYARQTSLDDVLAKYGNDPQRIMSEAPHLVAGEVILHFLSRHGFRMTIADLEQGIASYVPAEGKQLHRTTFSHRFRVAIHDRAQQMDLTDAQILDDYQKNERFIVNANQNKMKWTSDSPRRVQKPRTTKKKTQMEQKQETSEEDIGEYEETDGDADYIPPARDRSHFLDAPSGYAPAQQRSYFMGLYDNDMQDDPMDTSAFELAMFGTTGLPASSAENGSSSAGDVASSSDQMNISYLSPNTHTSMDPRFMANPAGSIWASTSCSSLDPSPIDPSLIDPILDHDSSVSYPAMPAMQASQLPMLDMMPASAGLKRGRNSFPGRGGGDGCRGGRR